MLAILVRRDISEIQLKIKQNLLVAPQMRNLFSLSRCTIKRSLFKRNMSGKDPTLTNLFGDAKNSHFNGDKINHLFEESAALNVYDKSVINLAAGCPGPDLLGPLTSMIKQAVNHRMNEEENQEKYYLFQYGPTAGLWGMRQRLSEFLTKKYGSKVNRENLILTCGATHGLHLLVSTVLASNGVVFVEQYTYMIALHLFKEFPNIKIYEVPINSDGVDVKKLYEIASGLKKDSTYNVTAQKPFWAMFYTIPNFHNPTGALLPPSKCVSLVKAARDLDFLVVCDDVYNLLYYTEDENPPARLFSYDDPKSDEYTGGNVVSNGTFSKILAPGVRVGWMELPSKLVSRFQQSGILQSGGSVNNVMFGIIESLIELGLAESHLDWYRQIYKKRMLDFCDALEKSLPKECKFLKPKGGYFVWIELPIDGGQFIKWCSQNGGPGGVPSIRFSLGSISSSYTKDSVASDSKSTYSPAIRLSIGFHDVETLTKAAEDIGAKLTEYIKTNVK